MDSGSKVTVNQCVHAADEKAWLRVLMFGVKYMCVTA